MAGLLGGFLFLAAANPAGAAVPGGPYLPNRYHCDYNGHGYHRCDGGYPNEKNPGVENEPPSSDVPRCPEPHRHTGYPYGSGCDRPSPG